MSAVRRWGPPLLWAAVIFFASAQSRVPSPDVRGFDKVEHFAAYAVLGVLLARAAKGWPRFAAWAALLGIAYGASDEIHQRFVPGRSPDWRDWVADALGVLAGVYVYHLWRSRRDRASAPARGAETLGT